MLVLHKVYEINNNKIIKDNIYDITILKISFYNSSLIIYIIRFFYY
jgi:hypothetical protein